MSRGPITAAKEGTLLNLRVSPGAKRSAIGGPYGDNAIKIQVSAPPTDGKANAEVERFLSTLLNVPRSDVAVIRGASSRDKTVIVRGLEPPEIEHCLASQPH